MEVKYYIIIGLISAAVIFLRSRNEKEAANIEEKKAVREKARRMLQEFQNSPDFNHPISKSVVKLIENYHVHDNVNNTLTEKQIYNIEERLKLKLPKSYKIFLRYFGDGGDWIFCQYIDRIERGGYLKEFDTHNQLDDYIFLGSEKIKITSILALMTEDSNGGAWVWLTDKVKKDNEYPLAYYICGKLHYKVDSFAEWLEVAASNEEVIRRYDVEEKLGLG
jgi:hypothetical protein